MIRGQELLCERINKSTLDSFPRTLMLLGDTGSGRHLLVNRIADHLSLQITDITDNISLETLDQICLIPEPHLYIIDIDRTNIREQNVILKFLEEPLKNAYIIILAQNLHNVIETVVNRCQQWQLAKYSKELLLEMFPDLDSSVLNFATTPGQVQSYQATDLNELVGLADKILTKIDCANVANILSISNKVAFKNDKGKLPIELLVQTLLQRALFFYKGLTQHRYLLAYQLTSELAADLTVANCDKQYLFERYLITLYMRLRSI